MTCVSLIIVISASPEILQKGEGQWPQTNIEIAIGNICGNELKVKRKTIV
jgi:hypothetical protein